MNNEKINVCAIIPAYNPDEALIDIIDNLMKSAFREIIVVNDGSSQEKETIFALLKKRHTGITLLRHPRKLGKGAALKTAFKYYLSQNKHSYGVVTLDADGQHLPQNALQVAKFLSEHPENLIVGVRQFGKNTPFRSRIGNSLTRWFFWLVTGINMVDTQSGLRGIPRAFLQNCLEIKPNDYDFELDMLLKAKRNELEIVQFPIETVYKYDNLSSHFNPLVDSVKIYLVFLRYVFIALLCFCIDYLVFISLVYLFMTTPWTTHVIIRFFTSFLNFLLNKYVVFKSTGNMKYEYLKYFICMLYVLVSTTFLLYFFNSLLGMQAFVAKPIGELITFLLSFILLWQWVFKKIDSSVWWSRE